MRKQRINPYHFVIIKRRMQKKPTKYRLLRIARAILTMTESADLFSFDKVVLVNLETQIYYFAFHLPKSQIQLPFYLLQNRFACVA